MGLSAEDQDRLLARYEIWGVETVRRELEREDRDTFIDPEVTAFAQAWVAAHERSARRRTCSWLVLAVSTMVLICAGLGLFVDP